VAPKRREYGCTVYSTQPPLYTDIDSAQANTYIHGTELELGQKLSADPPRPDPTRPLVENIVKQERFGKQLCTTWVPKAKINLSV